MVETEKSEAKKSLPEFIKVRVGDKNIMAKKVPLSKRLAIGEIFTKLLSALLKPEGNLIIEIERMNNADVVGLIRNCPVAFRILTTDWPSMINLATDAEIEFIDKEATFMDLFNIFKAIWEVNSFAESVQDLGKEIGGAQFGFKE